MNKNNLYKRMYSPMHGINNNSNMDYTKHNEIQSRNDEPVSNEIDVNDVLNQISALQDELNALRNSNVEPTAEPTLQPSNENEKDAKSVLKQIADNLTNAIK